MKTPSWLSYLLVVCLGLPLFALGQQASDGWAVRVNGSCQAQGLADCGTTVEPFSACCPLHSYCYDPYNRVCCQSGKSLVPSEGVIHACFARLFLSLDQVTDRNCEIDTNCTASVGKWCANSEWTMCDNNGYFCCEQQSFCYAVTSTRSNGCGDPGYIRKKGEDLLDALVQDRDATTISTTGSISAISVISSSSPSAIGMILIFRLQYLHAGSKPKRTRSNSAGPLSLSKANQPVAHEVSGTDPSQELDARETQELDTDRGFHELHDTRGGSHEMQ